MTDIDFEKLSELVVKFQQGDQNAFEQIYNMTYRTAKFTALKILNNNETDADDVMQDCYIKIMSKIDTLKDPSSFMSWFNMIVANQAKSVIRKNNPHFYEKDSEEDYSRYDDEWAKEYSDYGDSDNNSYSDNIGKSRKQEFIDEASSENYESFLPESSVEQEELCETVMEMIDSLSEEKKTAVVLFYYNNMTTKEISEAVGVSENTIKSRLVQAKKDISKAVKSYESKHGKLLAVSPTSLITWALKSTAATTSITPFAASGIAVAGTAATAGAVVSGTAAGTSVVTKIIAGVVIASVVAGGGVVGSRVSKNRKADKETTVTNAVVETYTEQTSAEIAEQEVEPVSRQESLIPSKPREEYTVPAGKNVHTYVESDELKYGVKYTINRYVNKDGSIYSSTPILDRKNYHATYEDLLSSANENQKKYSTYINNSVSEINRKREASGKKALEADSKLTVQANVRAEEVAWTALDSDLRIDKTSYTSLFDRNGYKTGSREEIRKFSFSSYESAIASILKNEEIYKDFDKIGVGVAVNPENNKYVFVVHLYTTKPGQADETISASDQKELEHRENVDDIINKRNGWKEKIDELSEKANQIPMIKDIMDTDYETLDVLSFVLHYIPDLLSKLLQEWTEALQ